MDARINPELQSDLNKLTPTQSQDNKMQRYINTKGKDTKSIRRGDVNVKGSLDPPERKHKRDKTKQKKPSKNTSCP